MLNVEFVSLVWTLNHPSNSVVASTLCQNVIENKCLLFFISLEFFALQHFILTNIFTWPMCFCQYFEKFLRFQAFTNVQWVINLVEINKFLEFFAVALFILTNIFYLTHFYVFLSIFLKKSFLKFQTFTKVRWVISLVEINKFLEFFAFAHFILTNIFYLTHFYVFFVNI